MAGTIGGSLFAAVAFSGAGYLFHLLDKGYDTEMKRHNLAMEHLSKVKEQWYEEVHRKDEIAQKRQELLASRADLSTVNKALDALRRMNVVCNNGNTKRTFTQKPELKDFYRPSTKMKHNQNIAMGIVGVGSGLVLGLII